MFRMLSSAIEHIHEKGIIFRDVHPTRVHIADGVVKLNLIGMPYNFKKLFKSSAYTGHLGTSAPETIIDDSGNSLSFKADVWALGCCFYLLATKRDPFVHGMPKMPSA